jgi:hypothetical protein
MNHFTGIKLEHECGENPYDAVSFAVKSALYATQIPSIKISTMDGYQHELEVFNNTHTQAHRCRKALGGGMRQAGILAAAGILSLTKGPTRVAQDHIFTKQLAVTAQEV